MRTWLTRIIWLLVLFIVATLLWDQRDRIALLSNNQLRIQGDWYREEMGFKGDDRYSIAERIITRNGIEWGSYELRRNTELEITTGDDVRTYRLRFPDDDSMEWALEGGGEQGTILRWQR